MTPIKKPTAPWVKLVPLLAGHLSMPQWLCQAAGAVLGAPWQACPAGECLMHWHQDVHVVFKLSKEAGEETAGLRADFTHDVALCLLAQSAPRPSMLQWASRQHRGQLFPWNISLGGSCG